MGPERVTNRVEHRTEYRIESRAPGKRKWEYRSFTGASGRDLEALQQRMSRAYEESPDGWKFRIVTREVVISLGPWEVLPSA